MALIRNGCYAPKVAARRWVLAGWAYGVIAGDEIRSPEGSESNALTSQAGQNYHPHDGWRCPSSHVRILEH
jgi:hypothetical protein